MIGKFIVIEGIDGAGTTTQTKKLVEKLNADGIKSIGTAEPTSSPLGKFIRSRMALKKNHTKEYFKTLALAFAADRMFHLEETILPQLKNGINVLTDRYLLSSLVYQGLSEPLEWIKEINKFAAAPDLTIFLQLPLAEAAARQEKRKKDSEVFEQEKMQALVHSRYLNLLNEKSDPTIIIDATNSINEVSSEIYAGLKKYFKF